LNRKTGLIPQQKNKTPEKSGVRQQSEAAKRRPFFRVEIGMNFQSTVASFTRFGAAWTGKPGTLPALRETDFRLPVFSSL
jgi:hypothetical protein